MTKRKANGTKYNVPLCEELRVYKRYLQEYVWPYLGEKRLIYVLLALIVFVYSVGEWWWGWVMLVHPCGQWAGLTTNIAQGYDTIYLQETHCIYHYLHDISIINFGRGASYSVWIELYCKPMLTTRHNCNFRDIDSIRDGIFIYMKFAATTLNVRSGFHRHKLMLGT